MHYLLAFLQCPYQGCVILPVDLCVLAPPEAPGTHNPCRHFERCFKDCAQTRAASMASPGVLIELSTSRCSGNTPSDFLLCLVLKSWDLGCARQSCLVDFRHAKSLWSSKPQGRGAGKGCDGSLMSGGLLVTRCQSSSSIMCPLPG